jgi:hypothetical protein
VVVVQEVQNNINTVVLTVKPIPEVLVVLVVIPITYLVQVTWEDTPRLKDMVVEVLPEHPIMGLVVAAVLQQSGLMVQVLMVVQAV